MFVNNLASSSGGVYSNVQVGSSNGARFIDCTFRGNKSAYNEGGVSYGGAAFINCTFLDNHSAYFSPNPFAPGGCIEAHSNVLVANCVFSGNSSSAAGGAIHVRPNVAATIINCTFASNSAGGPGAAINGPATITNCIFWNHATDPVVEATSITYSCFAPKSSVDGAGNINAEPRLVDPLGPDGMAGTEDDDLRLRADSPCINAANSLSLPADQFDLDGDGDTLEPLPLDLSGNARTLPFALVPNTGLPGPAGVVVDMGAHEYRRPADVAPLIGDGRVNVADLLSVINHWGPCPLELEEDCRDDITGDEVVNQHDLLAVILSWG